MSLIISKTPIEKVQTASSKEQAKEKAPEWHVRALEIITAGARGRGDADKEEFTRLIETNRDKINDLVYISYSTVLHELAKHGGPISFLPVLVRNNIDFSIQDTIFGDTPFHWALANGYNDIAKALIQQLPAAQLSSLDKQCRQGNTALHLIIAKGYTTHTASRVRIFTPSMELLRLAIDKGANFNLANREGNTPLHLAYARRDYAMAKLLIDSGADQNCKNQAGHKPKEMLSLGTSEQENYRLADKTLEDTVGTYHSLLENDYLNEKNLEALKAL